jgi:cell division protein FtsA
MKTVAAIDFGTSKIVTLLADSGGFTRCDIIGSGTVPYDGYMDGGWNAPGRVLAAIRDSVAAAEVESKRRITEVYVGVPCDYINILTAQSEVKISSEDGRVTDEDIDKIQDAAADALNIAARNVHVIHRSPAWFIVDDGRKTMSPIGVKGSSLKSSVSFITADPKFSSDIRAMMGQLGITVLAFLSPSMGASLLLLPLDERDRSAVFIDVGYLNTEFSVVEGDAITYHAVIPMGGGHITSDLAQTLEINMRPAEQIKRDFIFTPDEFDIEGDPEVRFENGTSVTFPRAFVQRTIMGTVNELADMLILTLKDAAPKLSPRSQVFLTGGGLAMMRGGREYLAERLGKSIKTPIPRAAKLNSPKYASSLGLIDLIFDSIDQQSQREDSIANRLSDGIKNLFTR